AGICDAASTVAMDGTSLPVATSGLQILAVACATNLAPSSTATATFDLAVTPVVLSTSGTCPETVTIGLDQSMAGSPPSGPTHNATICYSTNGTVPTSDCYNGNPPMAVTCF